MGFKSQSSLILVLMHWIKLIGKKQVILILLLRAGVSNHFSQIPFFKYFCQKFIEPQKMRLRLKMYSTILNLNIYFDIIQANLIILEIIYFL